MGKPKLFNQDSKSQCSVATDRGYLCRYSEYDFKLAQVVDNLLTFSARRLSTDNH